MRQIQVTSQGQASDHSNDVVRSPLQFDYSEFDSHQYTVRFFDAEGGEPPPLADPDVALITLDQAPLPGILHIANGRQYYWRNNGYGGWEKPRHLPDAPFCASFAQAGVAFIDMDGSGRPDLMLARPASLPGGYYENAGTKGWERFVAYPRERKAAPPWSSDRLRLSDIDGDGRIDALLSTDRAFVVWHNRGEGGWSDPVLVPRGGAEDAPDVDLANALVRLADMTGDGLQDLVRIGSGTTEYWPNLGNGNYGERIRMEHSPRLSGLHSDPSAIFLLDVDGDGCADLVYVNGDRIMICINRHGMGFADPVFLETLPPPIPGTIRPVNMSGNMSAGLLWNSYRGQTIGYVYVELSPAQVPYVLSTVNNGTGLVAELHYRFAIEDYLEDKQGGAIWDTNFPFPLLVVASTKETDLVTGQVTHVRYRYHEAHYESHSRQFQGFRYAEQIEEGDESRADTRTVSDYLMAMELAPGHGIEHAALNGSLARLEIYSQDGSAQATVPYHMEESEHRITPLLDTIDGRLRSFVYVAKHRTEDTERTNDLRSEEKIYTYDAVGNVIKEVRHGYGMREGVPQPELTRITEVTYAVGTTSRVLDKQASVVIHDQQGNLLSETRFYYDGPAFVGLPLGQLTQGLLMREARRVLPEDEFKAHYAGMDIAALGYYADVDHNGVPSIFMNAERHAYDRRGLKVADRDPLGVDKLYEYDTQGIFRTKLTETSGDTHFVYDRATGQPTTVTYGDGSVVRFAYDAQGRVRFALMPDDDPQQPPRVYSYDDSVVPNVRTVQMYPSKTASTFTTVLTYFDGRGNEYQQRVQVESAIYLVSGKRLFNPWGDLKEEYEPTFSTERAFSLPDTTGKPSRRFHYDGLGRIVQTINYNGGVSTASYAPFSITLADANDNDHSPDNLARGQNDTPHIEEFDVFLQRTKVIEVTGNGTTMTTRYTTDGNGRVVEVRDELSSFCVYKYDNLGNRYQIAHRAAGERRLWFDARGKVVRSVDANGNDLSVQLDARGRIQRLFAGGTVIEEYIYDEPAQHAYGKLAHVSYRAGSQKLHYDASGKLI